MTQTPAVSLDDSSYIPNTGWGSYEPAFLTYLYSEKDTQIEKTKSLFTPPNDDEYSECTIKEGNNETYCRFNLPALPNDMVTILQNLFNECNHSNWDGYDSEPITLNYFKDAKSFLLKLIHFLGKDMIKNMELSLAPDGTILYEWYGLNNYSLSLWLRKNNSVAYSYILFNENQHEMIDLGNEEGYKKVSSIINYFQSKNVLL